MILPKVNLKIKYHKTQNHVFTNQSRYKVICCGRRWGKTIGALNWLIENSFGKTNQLSWWVAPVYGQTKIAYRQLIKSYPQIIKHKSDSELRIELINNSVIEFKSADNPDNLRGAGLHMLVLDECAMMKDHVWDQILRPTLMESKGEVCFISTPKGQNFFYDLYQKGLETTNNDYKSFHYTSYDNPWIDNDEIDTARNEMPSRLYEQEIIAEFIENIGGVFRNVRQCVRGYLEKPVLDTEYTMGVDLGKYQDFTVITVMRKDTRHVVAFDRFNEISWSLQEQRILSLAEQYGASVLIDQGQVGDAILEDLQRKYTDIEGVRFTNENKTQMINYLSNHIEKVNITFPDIPELINELRIFEYETLASGRLRMNAPSGKHDDCVTSLMLAVWQLQDETMDLSNQFVERKLVSKVR